MGIKSMPQRERPRERLIKQGPSSLSDAELIAIILSTGNKKESALDLASKLTKKYDLKRLSRTSIGSLKKLFGVGDAKACQISACFELSRRLSRFKGERKRIVKNARDVVKIFMSEMNSLKKEHFKGIYLDTKGKIIKEENIFIGTLNESVVHAREIFQIAIEESAASIIMVHNHPSGNAEPSDEDVKMTEEIVLAGKIFGIPILDHIIIAGDKYFSFREKGFI